MKIIIFAIFISFLPFSLTLQKEDPQDFDYKLNSIAAKFKENIMDKYICEDLVNEADDVADEIEEALKNEEYLLEEINQLKHLKKEAEALGAFIASVSGNAGYIPKIEDFMLANQRVNGDIAVVIKDKFCVDVITVKINNHITYFLENNSAKSYIIHYKYKYPNGLESGSGKMGIFSKRVRCIYVNRENISQNKIIVYSIKCEETNIDY